MDERLRLQLRALLNTEQRALSSAKIPGSTYASSTAAFIDEPKTHAPSFFLSFSLALHVVRFAFLLWCHVHVSFGSFVVQGRTGQVDCRSDPEKNCSSHGLWSRSFQKYALESKNVPDLLALSKEKIGEVLECSFVDARTKGGDMYSRNSYVSAKAAIQRWLSASMTINIFTDPEFKRANAVLDGLLKEKKRQGLEAPVKHKDAISDADWKKIELHFADVLIVRGPIQKRRL